MTSSILFSTWHSSSWRKKVILSYVTVICHYELDIKCSVATVVYSKSAHTIDSIIRGNMEEVFE